MGRMRSLRFLPITFLAGQHGFLLFAPYLAVVLTAVEIAHAYQRRAASRATIASAPVLAQVA
jgi:hypothetical protein